MVVVGGRREFSPLARLQAKNNEKNLTAKRRMNEWKKKNISGMDKISNKTKQTKELISLPRIDDDYDERNGKEAPWIMMI